MYGHIVRVHLLCTGNVCVDVQYLPAKSVCIYHFTKEKYKLFSVYRIPSTEINVTEFMFLHSEAIIIIIIIIIILRSDGKL